MFSDDQYELMDFGNGRKLERFGDFVLDRPAPNADHTVRSSPELWSSAAVQFKRGSGQTGQWNSTKAFRQPWPISHDSVSLELWLSDAGHVGVFPDHAPSWDWVAARIRRARRPIKLLNLFAYTGAMTLAAAAEGAEVVHVDSAANIVRRARRNAELSGLADASIRWIVEDASKFVQRELKRGNSYDAVVLDPPSYGHGPKGEAWKLNQHLAPLLQNCARLTDKHREFFLFTCHTSGFGPAEAEALLADCVFGHCQAGATARRTELATKDGRRLEAGVIARWPNR